MRRRVRAPKKFQSSQHIKVLVGAGYSTRYNRRNLENVYYSGHLLTLQELVAKIEISDGVLVARQQLDLWLSKKTMDAVKHDYYGYPDGYSDDEDSDDPGRPESNTGGDALAGDDCPPADTAGEDSELCLSSACSHLLQGPSQLPGRTTRQHTMAARAAQNRKRAADVQRQLKAFQKMTQKAPPTRSGPEDGKYPEFSFNMIRKLTISLQMGPRRPLLRPPSRTTERARTSPTWWSPTSVPLTCLSPRTRNLATPGFTAR